MSGAPNIEQMRQAALNAFRKQPPPPPPSVCPPPLPPSSMTAGTGSTDNNGSQSNPKNFKVVREALLDLVKLGLSFSEIQSQSGANPTFLAMVYRQADLIPPPVREGAVALPEAQSTPGSASEVHNASFQNDRNSRSWPSQPSQVPQAPSTPSEPSAPIHPNSAQPSPSYAYPTHKQGSISQPPSRSSQSIDRGTEQMKRPHSTLPRFGSDRWSRQLNFELSDDDDDNDNDDNDSERATHWKWSKTTANSKPTTPLEAKYIEMRELQKRIEALKKKQKSSSPVPVLSNDPETQGTATGRDEGGSSQGTPIPENVSVSSTPEIQSLEGMLAEAKSRQSLVKERIADLDSQLDSVQPGRLEGEVAALRKKLDDKMNEMAQAAVRAASIRAQHSLAKTEQQDLLKRISHLSMQLDEARKLTDNTSRVVENNKGKTPVSEESDIDMSSKLTAMDKEQEETLGVTNEQTTQSSSGLSESVPDTDEQSLSSTDQAEQSPNNVEVVTLSDSESEPEPDSEDVDVTVNDGITPEPTESQVNNEDQKSDSVDCSSLPDSGPLKRKFMDIELVRIVSTRAASQANE
uniref:ARAD1D03498p n=1 Tax=Blastobotrys adeninivorans TaxID=409370 RepID=A0A060TD09_BLAAD